MLNFPYTLSFAVVLITSGVMPGIKAFIEVEILPADVNVALMKPEHLEYYRVDRCNYTHVPNNIEPFAIHLIYRSNYDEEKSKIVYTFRTQVDGQWNLDYTRPSPVTYILLKDKEPGDHKIFRLDKWLLGLEPELWYDMTATKFIVRDFYYIMRARGLPCLYTRNGRLDDYMIDEVWYEGYNIISSRDDPVKRSHTQTQDHQRAMNIFSDIGEFFRHLFRVLGDGLNSIIRGIEHIIGAALTDIKVFLVNTANSIRLLWDNIVTVLDEIWQLLVDIITHPIKYLLKLYSTVLNIDFKILAWLLQVTAKVLLAVMHQILIHPETQVILGCIILQVLIMVRFPGLNFWLVFAMNLLIIALFLPNVGVNNIRGRWVIEGR